MMTLMMALLVNRALRRTQAVQVGRRSRPEGG
jgi:hypothetical protein